MLLLPKFGGSPQGQPRAKLGLGREGVETERVTRLDAKRQSEPQATGESSSTSRTPFAPPQRTPSPKVPQRRTRPLSSPHEVPQSSRTSTNWEFNRLQRGTHAA
jgi:hypothetical protein